MIIYGPFMLPFAQSFFSICHQVWDIWKEELLSKIIEGNLSRMSTNKERFYLLFNRCLKCSSVQSSLLGVIYHAFPLIVCGLAFLERSNVFHVIGLFRYAQKISENLWFSVLLISKQIEVSCNTHYKKKLHVKSILSSR